MIGFVFQLIGFTAHGHTEIIESNYYRDHAWAGVACNEDELSDFALGRNVRDFYLRNPGGAVIAITTSENGRRSYYVVAKASRQRVANVAKFEVVA